MDGQEHCERTGIKRCMPQGGAMRLSLSGFAPIFPFRVFLSALFA